MIRISDTMAQELGNFLPLDHPIRARILDQLEHGNFEADLLSEVEEIIASPHVDNILSRDSLQLLQEALFSPRALRVLKEKRKTELGCAECGNTFHERSLATTHNGVVFCSSCLPPATIVCPGCEQIQNAEKSIANMLRKYARECPYCRGEKLRPHPPGPEPLYEPQLIPTPTLDTRLGGREVQEFTAAQMVAAIAVDNEAADLAAEEERDRYYDEHLHDRWEEPV